MHPKAYEHENLRKENGLLIDKKPTLSQLRFVQIDEFYPLDSNQHNSFFYYVNKYYIKDFIYYLYFMLEKQKSPFFLLK